MMIKCTQKRALYWLPALAIVWTLSACGGSEGESKPPPPPPVTIDSGQFIDAAVTGLTYVSGETTGVTDMSGRFNYEREGGLAQDVTFSFGDIVIGSAAGKPVLTPLDLIPGGGASDAEVLNITRFLQLLDSDGDPRNGIEPSAALIAAVDAQQFGQIDFAITDFANQAALTDLIGFLNSVDPQPHVLPSAQEAQAHLQDSLACLSSGIYSGRFQGEDGGHFALLIQHQRVDPLLFGDDLPRTGVASALIYSEAQDRLIGLLPQQALVFDSDSSFIAGVAANGAQLAGSLQNFEQLINGQWRNDLEGGMGTFSGARINGDLSAVYRLAGGFGDETPFDPFDDTADNRGGIALDIFADNTVTGTMISARGNQHLLSGVLNGEIITASSADGVAVSITFDASGTNPLSDLVGLFGVPGFWGSWQQGNVSGGVSGTSCEPN